MAGKKYQHDRDSEEWERAANNLARQFAPAIYDCGDCGAPVAHGWCCTYCGSTSPDCSPPQEEQ